MTDLAAPPVSTCFRCGREAPVRRLNAILTILVGPVVVLLGGVRASRPTGVPGGALSATREVSAGYCGRCRIWLHVCYTTVLGFLALGLVAVVKETLAGR